MGKRGIWGEKKEDCEEEGKGSAAGRDKEREGKWEEKRKERGGKVCMCLLDVGNCMRAPRRLRPRRRRGAVRFSYSKSYF